MNRLPDVLLQLTLQLCDLTSLLRFARINQRLRAVADAPFVLKHVRLHVTPAKIKRANGIAISACRPLRHACVCLTLTDADSKVDLSALLDQMPPLYSLTDDRDDALATRLHAALLHPSVRSIRALHCGDQWCTIAADEQWMQSLRALTYLRTLTLHPEPQFAVGAHRMLSTLPALTELKTQPMLASQSAAAPLASVAAPHYPHLTSVHLIKPHNQLAFFESFFTTAQLPSQIRSLTLEGFSRSTHTDYAALLSACVSLTELHLRNVQCSALLLSHADLCPLLTSVRVTACGNMMGNLAAGGSIPTEDALTQMLTALPRISCALRIVWQEGLFDDPVPNEETRILDSLQRRYSSAELAQFGARFALSCEQDRSMTLGG